MLLGETAEVQVGKDIAQQDKPLEMSRLQESERIRPPG